MSGVLAQLARPATDADRRRARLVSAGVAGCGVFILAAVAIMALTGDAHQGSGVFSNGRFHETHGPNRSLLKLAPYLAESGMRHGTALGAMLLVIPFGLFGLQALRTGSVARERRLAALSLAGATRAQLRRLAVLEGTRAALLGGLLAGPGYLLLWLVFGLLLPVGWRMLPDPSRVTLLAWVGLLLLLSAIGAVGAGLAARPANVTPLGVVRRNSRRLGGVDAVVPVLSGLLIVLGLAKEYGVSGTDSLWLVLMATVFLALSGGSWLILLSGWLAARRGLIGALAGGRLLADVRSPGRVTGVLFAVGVAFGVMSGLIGELLIQVHHGETFGGSLGFYLGGYAVAGVAALVVILVTASALVVGATEQVLDSRRGTAVLVALAASPRFVLRVVRRQLLIVAVPACVLGAVVGWLGTGVPAMIHDGLAADPLNLLSLPVAVLVAALAATLAALAASRLVRPAILESSTPDNLRAP